MWVFANKQDKFNCVVRFKARWVVFGNHQIKNVDFKDTYASVGKVDSLKILLALAASKNLIIQKFGVKTAFLNGDMVDAVYCRQVTGFINKVNAGKVWLLNKSLYGTQQAARRWQRHFSKTVSMFGLKPTVLDEAVYVMKDARGLLLIHLHVDDSLLFCNNPVFLEDFKVFLHLAYELDWTVTPTLYLGIKLNIQKDLIAISQPQYIEAILNRFAMTNCKSANSPLPSKCMLLPGTEEDIKAAQNPPFQQLVGCLQWLSITTRANIADAVSQVSRFNTGPWQSAFFDI